jgi:hypothetical protein
MKVGYLVRVKDTTHDPELPPDRVGLVARVWEGAPPPRTPAAHRGGRLSGRCPSCQPAHGGTDGRTFCEVRFPNGALLDFHIEFLEVLGES